MTDNLPDPEPEVDPEAEVDPDATPEEPETFPRSYVEELRREAAEHRTRAQGADEARQRLLAATIREATAGVLADPTDLPTGDHLLGEDGFPDPELIRGHAEALVDAKPHLGDRRPRGDVGQGARPDGGDVDLAGMLRGLAG